MSFLSDTKIGFFAEYSYLCVDVKWMYMKINALKRHVRSDAVCFHTFSMQYDRIDGHITKNLARMLKSAINFRKCNLHGRIIKL